MFSPKVIAASAARFESKLGRDLVEYSVPEVEAWTSRLSDVFDAKGKRARDVTGEEQDFIDNELLMTKVSWRYWAERYAFINKKGAGLTRMYPLLDSQKLILEKIGAREELIHSGEWEDGILFDLLKARQLGASTLVECISAHRLTTQNHIFGLVASDDIENSGYLFDMFERIVEYLPWYLRPEVLEHVKNKEMLFDGGSHIWMGSGKSARGTSGERGNLGRGKTLSFVHLSEVSTWENTRQIKGALLPTMHPSPRLFCAFESTAKGRGNFLHKHWQGIKRGGDRFFPIFIPWYAEPNMYRRTPPEGWAPNPVTLAHAKRVEATGERWVGKPVRLAKDQLYWYEFTREQYEKDGELSTFLEEYAGDDEEAFQYSGRGIFPAHVIEDVRAAAKPILDVLEVGPMTELQRDA